MTAATALRQVDILAMPRPPVVLAYGIGVDSTAMLLELVARGEKPDLVLTADTGSEKPATYAYLDVIRPWMAAHGIDFRICRYEPQRFKHWPPYATLVENVLTDATLPSISLGRHTCSLGPRFESVLFGYDKARGDLRPNRSADLNESASPARSKVDYCAAQRHAIPRTLHV